MKLKVSELKPGRELDALVAEHVMGWTVKGFILGKGIAPIPPNTAVCSVASDIPNYSTSIEDAWLVVEKIRNHHPGAEGFEISCDPIKWYASTRCGDEAEADTAPMAICLAALKALGVIE